MGKITFITECFQIDNIEIPKKRPIYFLTLSWQDNPNLIISGNTIPDKLSGNLNIENTDGVILNQLPLKLEVFTNSWREALSLGLISTTETLNKSIRDILHQQSTPEYIKLRLKLVTPDGDKYSNEIVFSKSVSPVFEFLGGIANTLGGYSQSLILSHKTLCEPKNISASIGIH